MPIRAILHRRAALQTRSYARAKSSSTRTARWGFLVSNASKMRWDNLPSWSTVERPLRKPAWLGFSFPLSSSQCCRRAWMSLSVSLLVVDRRLIGR